ncbi:MAG: adenylate/guanylate cyclase domain-containing protein [Nanoarchaeota archaeon]
MKTIYLVLLIIFSVNVIATRVDLTRVSSKGESLNIDYQGQTTVISDFIVKNRNFLCDIECKWNSSQNKEGFVPNIINAGDASSQFSVSFDAIKDGFGNLVVGVNVECHDINSTFCSDSDFGIDKEAITINYKFCGDGKADFEEECDKEDKKGKVCMDLGFSGGVLNCNNECKLILDGCYKCGDNKLNSGEQCDGTDLGNKTCFNLGFSGGSLTCNDKCMFDTSACYNCGNNIIDLNENCKNCPSDVKCGVGEECNPDRKEANQIGCAPKCGNNVCDADENYETCKKDCEKPVKCGDKTCDISENCNSCKEDCACFDGYLCSGGQCVLEFKYKEKQSSNLAIILIFILTSGTLLYYKRNSIKGLLKEKREFSVIMFTDLKDFCKRVEENEDRALRKLWMYENIMKGIISKYNGKVVKTIGDALMVEFKSSISAVKCAKEIQNNALLKKYFLIKIGIHVGEIIRRKNDIFGNGVNIAARICSLAEAGSVYISEDIYKNVKNKLNYRFTNLGLKELRNIKEPIIVYKI